MEFIIQIADFSYSENHNKGGQVMRKAKTIMSLALSVAMVTSMAATAPVMAAESESTDGFNLNLCIASEPQSIDPALNTAMDGSVMCHHKNASIHSDKHNENNIT